MINYCIVLMMLIKSVSSVCLLRDGFNLNKKRCETRIILDDPLITTEHVVQGYMKSSFIKSETTSEAFKLSQRMDGWSLDVSGWGAQLRFAQSSIHGSEYNSSSTSISVYRSIEYHTHHDRLILPLIPTTDPVTENRKFMPSRCVQAWNYDQALTEGEINQTSQQCGHMIITGIQYGGRFSELFTFDTTGMSNSVKDELLTQIGASGWGVKLDSSISSNISSVAREALTKTKIKRTIAGGMSVDNVDKMSGEMIRSWLMTVKDYPAPIDHDMIYLHEFLLMEPIKMWNFIL